jgi:hypothetical protein
LPQSRPFRAGQGKLYNKRKAAYSRFGPLSGERSSSLKGGVLQSRGNYGNQSDEFC